MYRAKERGKDRCEVFDEHDARARPASGSRRRTRCTARIERGEFRVFYQPIIALARRHRRRASRRWCAGSIPSAASSRPIDFIALAEETGLIVPIGAWVLEEACRAAVEWRGALAVGERFRLSVNLSGRQLVHAELADLVAGVLARAACARTRCASRSPRPC